MIDVSVIIPFYNALEFLDRIVNDLNNQIFKDFEVIFVDDGSTDNSYNAIDNMIRRNICKFNASLVRQENKGVSTARNLGITKAVGRYFCFVDVDDGITDEYLEAMYSVMQKEDADVVFCKTTDQQISKSQEYFILNKVDALERYLFRNLTTGVWSMMVKNVIICENNLKFADGFKYSEDLHMVFRIIACSNKIILLEKQLYIYYKNYGSAMRKFDENRFDTIRLFKNLEEYFCENNPDFYTLYKQYGVAYSEWSVLWQAAYHLKWIAFNKFTKEYNFKAGLRKLASYPSRRVQLSSKVFLVSKTVFFVCVKFCINRLMSGHIRGD